MTAKLDDVSDNLLLASLLLDTVIDPTRCGHALRELCHALKASAGQLTLLARADGRIIMTHAFGLSASAKRAFLAMARENLVQSDPRLRAALRRPNRPHLGHKLIPDSTLHRSEFYKSFLKSSGLEHALVLPIVLENNGAVLVLSLMRASDHSQFNELDVKRLRGLVPHLQRIAEVALKQQRKDDEVAVLSTLFDRLAVAVVVVGRKGHVLYENAAAAALIRRQPGLRRIDGRLSHSSPQHAAELAAAIELHSGDMPAAKPHHLLLPHGDNGALLHAAFSQLSGTREASDGASRESYVAISLVDPKRTYEPDEATLQVSFGLTVAEASILKLLAEGVSINRIAAMRGSALGTVRTQIGAILSKTGTHRQADLIRLALTAAPLFREQ